MPSRAKQSKRSKAKRSLYRNRFPMQLQMANQKPPTVKVMIEAFDRYFVDGRDQVNGCSILRIPANFMQKAEIVTGGWTDQSGVDLAPVGYERYVDMYRHYHVLGSYIEVTAVNGTATGPTGHQFHNFIALARTDTPGQFTVSTSAIAMEKAYGVKTARWGGVSAGASKGGAVKMGYNPHKQFGVKDTIDNPNLRVPTSLDLSTLPNERAFFEIALKGLLDNVTEGHPDCVVDVKVKYILQYTEPIADSDTSLSNQPTILK